MKFSNLQVIIQNVRRRVRCPDCKRAYKANEITIVDLYEAECMLDLYCPHCKCGFSFNFEIAEVDGKLTVTEKPCPSCGGKSAEHFFREEPHITPHITEDEATRITRILKDHKGGLGELLGG